MKSSTQHKPIIGNLAIETSGGRTIHATSDLALAWAWAEDEVTETGGDWRALSYRERCDHAADALAELRRAYAVVTGDDDDPDGE